MRLLVDTQLLIWYAQGSPRMVGATQEMLDDRANKDPFDRILIAQATTEGMILLTADRVVARYPGPVRLA